LWGSGIASGIVDNIPFALSMAYVLENIIKFAGVPAMERRIIIIISMAFLLFFFITISKFY